MPPAALKPTAAPRRCAAIAPIICRAAGNDAPCAVLPVLVFRKSTPLSRPSAQACAIACADGSSPDSMISFSRLPTQALRTCATNCAAAACWPSCMARHGNTRSTSSPPPSTMVCVSASARSRSSAPSGKFATAATATSRGNSALDCAAKRGHTHTAATWPHGVTARWHKASIAAASSLSFRLVRSRHASVTRALARSSALRASCSLTAAPRRRVARSLPPSADCRQR